MDKNNKEKIIKSLDRITNLTDNEYIYDEVNNIKNTLGGRTIKGIIAVNKLWYIGLNGSLPWKCSDDLRHFKKLTNGCKLLVGYNTSKNLPMLINREIIIDDRNELVDTSNIDWCIGGAKTYEKYCHLFSELHVSIIGNETIGDVKYPDFSKINPDCKTFYYNFETNE